jgi:HK97 family phage prohead protease
MGQQMRDISDRAKGMVYRNYDIVDFEFRDGDGGGFTFEGVASVVDAPYTVRDQFGEFTETISSGAFNKTLRDSKANVSLFVNHRHGDVPLATRLAKTLRLTADPNLRANANLDPIRSDVQIVRSAVTRGELSQMSIGFTVPRDKNKDIWSEDYSQRTIKELQLVEVSIVTQGANPLTEASMRSFDEIVEAMRSGAMTKAELARLSKMAKREVLGAITDPFVDMLTGAVEAAIGSGNSILNIETYTDSTVVYSLGLVCYQLNYKLDANGYPVITSTPVVVVEKYEPVEPTKVEEVDKGVESVAGRSAFADRDREDRERLERKRLLRPLFV